MFPFTFFHKRYTKKGKIQRILEFRAKMNWKAKSASLYNNTATPRCLKLFRWRVTPLPKIGKCSDQRSISLSLVDFLLLRE